MAPRIAIVGAGFGGLCMAIRLRRAGIDSFTVFERASGLGGTWRDNTYPGAGCDIRRLAARSREMSSGRLISPVAGRTY